MWDVGANVGQMALIFASLVGRSGRVVAIEPAPLPCRSLQRNMLINGLDQVHVLQAAAANAAGTMLFGFDPAHPSQGKLTAAEPTYATRGALFPVPAISLDGLLDREPPPDVIKIDVEGAAALVLRGAARILDQGAPHVYVELHGPEEQAGVRDELLSRGYVAWTLDGERVADPVGTWHGSLWCLKPDGRAG